MNSIVRILRSAEQLHRLYVLVVVGAVLTSATALAVPFLISAATDQVVSLTTGGGGALRTVVWLVLLMLAVELANSVITNLAGYVGDVAAARLKSVLSTRYFEKLLRLPQSYFDNELSGTIIGRLNRSITVVGDFFNMFANNFFPMLVSLAAALFITGWYSPWLAGLLVVIYPIFGWLTGLTSRKWQVWEREKNAQLDAASGRFAEAITQMRVVKSFVGERRELDVFTTAYDRSVGITRQQSRFWHRMDVARRVALNVVFFGIYLIIFVAAAQGQYSIGSMVLLIQLVTMARQPVTSLSYLVDTTQRAIAGSRDYFEAMNQIDEPGAVLTAAAPTPLPPTTDKPMIEFSSASFGYTPDALVLRDIDLSVQRGERIAFVGESGGGKTTLVNLLLRLYPVTSGTIRVLGDDIAELPLATLRGNIGVVFQDASLFSGTIAENIAYGRQHASRDEIVAAAVRANADSFISGLAEGYDARIGERGIKLSGGQKQRIAVARAMLADAPILVLDEATSALDSKAERAVQAGLEELLADRTTLIIAHRLSTISSVDRIVTLAEGSIDEIGTPEELATSGGIYSELLALQAADSKAAKARLRAFDIVK
ncbi:MAG: ABC transporter ATP-binding protein [Arachnia sp.]